MVLDGTESRKARHGTARRGSSCRTGQRSSLASREVPDDWFSGEELLIRLDDQDDDPDEAPPAPAAPGPTVARRPVALHRCGDGRPSASLPGIQARGVVCSLGHESSIPRRGGGDGRAPRCDRAARARCPGATRRGGDDLAEPGRSAVRAGARRPTRRCRGRTPPSPTRCERPHQSMVRDRRAPRREGAGPSYLGWPWARRGSSRQDHSG